MSKGTKSSDHVSRGARPTALRLIDLFGNVQRHTLTANKHADTVFVTDLSSLQRKILKLFRLPATTYGH